MIFVSGFAAAVLEVVMLFGFQVLYGSVYRQLGLIVAAFMAGLVAGAWMANREKDSRFIADLSTARARRSLAALAWTLAVFAVAVPFVLKLLALTSGAAAPIVVAVLTFVLGGVVGMEFPMANRAQVDGGALAASRLYSADFMGGFLGAILASTLLIPIFGVTTVCLLTAAANAAGAAVLFLRKG